MSQNKGSGSDAALGVGAVVLMTLCCAGPVLIAAGALGAIGGFLSNPLVVVAGAALALTAIVGVARRRASDDSCCPPSDMGADAPTQTRSPDRSSR